MDWRKLLCYLLIGSFPLLAHSQPSPIGLWQTYDLDHTPRDIIKISQNDNQLIGIIVKPAGKSNFCTTCPGTLHNKPIKGLQIIWGLKQQENAWRNGHVLSIDNGKIYQCTVSVSADNKVLHFAPFIGNPLFGVTLDWVRVE